VYVPEIQMVMSRYTYHSLQYVLAGWIEAQLWNDGEIHFEADMPPFVDFDTLITLSETEGNLATSPNPATPEDMPLEGEISIEFEPAPVDIDISITAMEAAASDWAANQVFHNTTQSPPLVRQASPPLVRQASPPLVRQASPPLVRQSGSPLEKQQHPTPASEGATPASEEATPASEGTTPTSASESANLPAPPRERTPRPIRPRIRVPRRGRGCTSALT
jgi:hypothetical protein